MSARNTGHGTLAATFLRTALCIALIGFWRGDPAERILHVEVIAALAAFAALPVLTVEYSCNKRIRDGGVL